MSGLYAAYAGAKATWRELEVLSDNVANATSTGFREQKVRFEMLDGAVRATGGGYTADDGALIKDNVGTHLALQGDAWFTLADGSFTRDGRLKVSEDGTLVTTSGTPVLGQSGPVVVEPGRPFTITPEGMVLGPEGDEIDTLRLSSLQNATPLGGGRWSGTGAPAVGAEVVQGALEGSNVNTMRSMVDLVSASRAFEAHQKAMQASDDADQRLLQIKG
jgi:flagellar basal-body rod protein FlgF